jgi:serine/threonine protein kinase
MEIKGEVNICPHCNYDEQDYQASALHIKPRTILHDRYVIGNAVGQGGFGITYIGKDIVLNKKVAIKEYLPTMLAARAPYETQENTRYTVVPWDNAQNRKDKLKEGLNSFLEEARRLAELDHENIVRVINFFEENNTAYIVMEYAGQENLSDLLKRRGGTLPVQEALNILLPILDALKQIHAKQFFHRDISAANIRIVNGKKPVLIDFGAAKYLTSEVSHSLEKVYKPGYSPIEQMAGSKKIGAWTDIYACGATFYLMLTGKLPPISIERFDKDELAQLTDFPELNIPQHINNATLYALAVRAEDRFATVDEFKQALTNPEVSRIISKPPSIYTDETAQLVEDISIKQNDSKESVQQEIKDSTEKPKKTKLPLLLTALLASVFIVFAAIYWFSLPKLDDFTVKGFDKPYVIGNKVDYEIIWQDKIIKSIIFKLQNTNIIKMHDVSENITSQQGSFDTSTLNAPQDYPYTITLIDNKGQSYELPGQLKLWEVDSTKPKGSITGIKSTYKEGERVSYQIDIEDNRQLERVIFLVKQSPVDIGFEQEWQQAIFSKTDGFGTDGWIANKTYDYELKAIDTNKNIFTEKGQFYLQEVDRMAPTGEIANVYEKYDEGDYVHVQIKASDNKQLKTIEFKIQGTQIRKTWSVDKDTFNGEVPIPTQGWEVNRDYTYVLTVVDAENNEIPKTGSFYLKGVDNNPPTLSLSGLKEQYFVGTDVTIYFQAKDDVSLKNATIRLENTNISQNYYLEGKQSEKSFTFSTSQLQVKQTYKVILNVVDSANNSQSAKQTFYLTIEDKQRPTATVSCDEQYKIGEKVQCQLTATDNEQLTMVKFVVTGSSINEKWSPNQTQFNEIFSFDTNGWQAERHYDYYIEAIDSSQLHFQDTGRFFLAAQDISKPTAHIAMQKQYQEGDDIVASIELTDNKQLKSFEFYISGKLIEQNQNINQASFKKIISLKQLNLIPGQTHDYLLIVTDIEGNTAKQQDSFILIARDKQAPTGKILDIKNSYRHGDIVYYQVEAQDNKQLSEVSFEVKNTPIQQRWSTNEAQFNRSGQFDTSSLMAGKTYSYVLSLVDSEGLKSVFTQNFIIKAVDNEKPIGKIDINKTYDLGENISYQLNLTDNMGLKSASFSIKGLEFEKTWQLAGETKKLLTGSITTSGLSAGRYTYIFELVDLENNRDTHKGFVELLEISIDEQKLAELEVECQKRFDRWDFTTVDSAEGKAEGAGTALDCYNEMLALQPENAFALAGLQNMIQHYTNWANGSLSKERFSKVEGYIEKIRTINPNAVEIGQLKTNLANKRTQQTKPRQPRITTTKQQPVRQPKPQPVQPKSKPQPVQPKPEPPKPKSNCSTDDFALGLCK